LRLNHTVLSKVADVCSYQADKGNQHAHGAYSAEHASNAINATVDSGARCIYCYTYNLRIDKWTKTECIPNSDMLPSWATTQIEKLATDQSWGKGRVTIGFGFEFFFLPKDVVVGVFTKIRPLGIKTITIHVARNGILGRSSTTGLLN
jgi:hypothetical protein